MAGKKINLQIIGPTRQVLNEEVDFVVFRTTEGDMGVLYGREPVVALLAYGKLKYKQNGIDKYATVMGGFVEVTKDKVTILTDASELEEEIDVERARAAKERAQKRRSESDMDALRAEIALKKALLRLSLKEK